MIATCVATMDDRLHIAPIIPICDQKALDAKNYSNPLCYNSNPPTSGPHMGNLANWGVHYQPIPDELQVHNLEDKGVVIQYSCSPECPDLAGKLEAIVKRYKDFVVLAPRPGMDKRIALTAWGKIDTFDEFDEARIVRFIKRFRGIDHHGEG